MKSEVKKIDSTKREISIEITGDVVKNKFEEVFKKIGETAKVAGFRPGHAPRDILEKNFSAQAHQMVLEGLIPDVYQEALKKENIDAIEMPEISEVKIDRANLSFKATVEVAPEIKLKNYKKLKADYKKIEVTTDEIKRQLDALRESRKIDALDDSFARSLGFAALSDLEKAIERQLFSQKENLQKQKIEDQIIETVIKDLDFNVPQSMVKRQLDDLVRQAKVELALKGMPREKIDEQEKGLTERLQPQAQRQVKVYLVLAEIAKKENIPLDEHMPGRVIEFLLREADWS